MIGNTRLIELLDNYQIDGKKLINNNPNVLEYGEYDEIEKILDYLINEIGCTPQNIEKCPSILYFTTRDSIKKNYEYLATTELNDEKIKNTLSCLNGDLLDLQYNYEYLIRKVGKERLNKSLSCINMDSIEMVNICKYFEERYGKEKLRECISGISGIYSSFDKVKKILDLSIWKEHPELLTPNVFQRSAEEIEKILDLDAWKEHPELLTPNVFQRSAEEIEKILNLDIWATYPELLTSSVFRKTAEEIMKRYKFITEEINRPEIINKTTMFTMKQEEFEAKLNFLEEHGLPLINEKGKVNSIFGMSNENMKKKLWINQERTY